MTFGWPNSFKKKKNTRVLALKTVWKHVVTQGDRRGKAHGGCSRCTSPANHLLLHAEFFSSFFSQEHLGLCAFSAEWAQRETSASPEALAPRLTKRENASRLFFPHCAPGGAATRSSHQACPMKSEPGLHFTRTAVKAIRTLFTFTP